MSDPCGRSFDLYAIYIITFIIMKTSLVFKYKRSIVLMMNTIICTFFISSCKTTKAVEQSGSGIEIKELIRTDQSWDGAALPDYFTGRPELVAVRYVFPPGQKLGWHHHEVMNYGIVEQGELTIIGLDGKEKVVHEGEVVVEMVNTIHHGENRGGKPVILNMFYISQEGKPLAVQHPEIPMK